MKSKKRIGALAAAIILGMGAFVMPHTAQAEIKPDENPVTGLQIYKALYDPQLSIGGRNTVSGDVYAVFGFLNEVGESAAAIGNYNTAAGEGATAVGLYNEANENSTALGFVNTANGVGAVAIGTQNTSGGKLSSAVGVYNEVYGENSAAFGYQNIVGEDGAESGKDTYVFGANNTVKADNAIVVGTSVTGTIGNGAIVLGTNITGSVAANSVVIGDGSTSEEANTVSVGTKGNERKIVHVALGEASHEVATWDQLIGKAEYDVTTGKLTFTRNDKSTFDVKIPNSSADVGDTSKLSKAGLGENVTDSVLSVNDKVETLSDDVKKVGAGAAALAALRPEAFDPMDKWSFAVGYGHYKSANAGALGAFFKPNADTTLSIGSTIGNGDPMMNAGVSFKLGQRGSKLSQNASNSQLVQEVNTLRAENAQQAQEIRELKAQMAKVLAKLGG